MTSKQDDNGEKGGVSPGWQRMSTHAMRRLDLLVQARVGKNLAGRFQIERLLAMGGMAAVYEAMQRPLNRRVAVKVLHPSEIEAGRRDYFLREANSAAQLRHPNIISVVDFGQEDDGTLWLAMEHVPGMTFSELLGRDYPLEIPRLIHIIEQVCLALEVAHQANVIHCDMKPSNIMIESVPGNPDHVKVLDFGISRTLQKPGDKEENEEIIGSYYYMAPEQVAGKHVTPQTDVYGLGVVLYTALTAAFPFEEPDDQALMKAIIQKVPPAPSAVRPELQIPPALDAVVMKAMAKHPADRFASCAEMRKALLQVKEQRPAASPLAMEGPHSLEILLSEEELFDVDIDLDLPDEDDLDGPLQVTDTGEINLTHVNLDALDVLDPSFSQGATPAPQPPGLARAPSMTMSSPSGLGSTLFGAQAPIIGRAEHMTQLLRVAASTRRSPTATLLRGEHGCGGSFFLSRALEKMQADLGSTVLLCRLVPGDREYPLRSLSRVVGAALDEALGMLGGEVSADGRRSFRAREKAFQRLNLGNLETASLHGLLTRWSLPDLVASRQRPYDDTTLRFPETRHQLLFHALGGLLSALHNLSREFNPHERAARAPLALALDGWEHCDPSSRQILSRLLTEQNQLPLCFVALSHLPQEGESPPFLDDLDSPDTSPYLDGRAWDLSLIFSPFNLEEVRSYVTYRIGRSPDDGLTRRIAAASGGNALLIKDLVHHFLGGTPMPGEPLGREWSLRDLPDSPQRLFTQQIENLSRDGKMLLAVCTLLGDTFPEEAVRVVVPYNFDVDGIFTELFSARILEPSGDLRRLRFRYPQMRLLSIERLQGTLRRALHARIAGFLATHALSLQAEEAALWRATHTLGSGYPNEAVDVLLQAAEESLDAWDPDLAVRRCRQAQLWLYACAQLKLCPPNTVLLASAPRAPLPLIAPELLPAVRVEDLEVASARAAMSLIHAARRLLLPPEDGPDAVVPERITQALLQQVTDSPHLPLLLRADAAFEVGRYLSRVERPQGARRAFQIAHAHARALQDQAMLLHLDMEMANNLQRLGRAGQALDLTHQVIQALRPLEHAPTLPHGTRLRLSRPLDLLAKIYIERRLYPRAEHYLDQALAIAEADNDFDRIGKLCLQYAALYRAQNNHVRTLQALHRALDAAKRTHDLRAMARVLYNQGVTTAHLGHRADARLYLSDAIQVAINLGMTDFIALVNGQLRHL